jgi:hypothetical protein
VTDKSSAVTANSPWEGLADRQDILCASSAASEEEEEEEEEEKDEGLQDCLPSRQFNQVEGGEAGVLGGKGPEDREKVETDFKVSFHRFLSSDLECL